MVKLIKLNSWNLVFIFRLYNFSWKIRLKLSRVLVAEDQYSWICICLILLLNVWCSTNGWENIFTWDFICFFSLLILLHWKLWKNINETSNIYICRRSKYKLDRGVKLHGKLLISPKEYVITLFVKNIPDFIGVGLRVKILPG